MARPLPAALQATADLPQAAARPRGRPCHWDHLSLARRSATRADVEARYRSLARALRPRAGGDDDAFAELGYARDQALADLRAAGRG